MRIHCVGLLLAAFTIAAFAQDTTSVKMIPIGTQFSKEKAQTTLGFLPDDESAFECSNPPAISDIRQARFSTSLTVLTAEQAAKLKISFLGNLGGQYDKNQQVLVSQVGRM